MLVLNNQQLIILYSIFSSEAIITIALIYVDAIIVTFNYLLTIKALKTFHLC